MYATNKQCIDCEPILNRVSIHTNLVQLETEREWTLAVCVRRSPLSPSKKPRGWLAPLVFFMAPLFLNNIRREKNVVLFVPLLET